MATKDEFLLGKDKSFVNDVSYITDNQHSNLNLKQNQKSSILSSVQTCNKSSKVQNCTDATVSDNCKEKEKLQLRNKSPKIKDSVILSDEAERDDKKQQNDEVPKPEISQFRASQRLLNLDEMSFSTRQEAMEALEFKFDAYSQNLFSQELRIKQKALDDLKKDYEQLKIREQTLMEKTRWEQGRTKAQEDKVKSLNEEIEKLKEDYECVIMERDNLKKEISALRRKSNDNTFRLQYESEIISYRTKIAGLESRLSRRQVEFDKSEEHMRHEIEKLQNLLDNTQIRLESSSASYSEKENLDSSSVEKLNDLHFKIGDLTATNKALRDEINRHVSEKSELQE
uniref:Uncharacterized protein n=1 Tax=Panagrolaimus sp. PS1159 TaxID=55785 RepID=A0AC35GKK5_9BILA